MVLLSSVYHVCSISLRIFLLSMACICSHVPRFADIKGFTSMVNQLHPSQVMLFLNTLYSVWDTLLPTFDVYKVETIGGGSG